MHRFPGSRLRDRPRGGRPHHPGGQVGRLSSHGHQGLRPDAGQKGGGILKIRSVQSLRLLIKHKTKKGKHTFDYPLMKEINGGKQMKDVWLIPLVSKQERKYGKHPTQKPEALLERIILASTKEGDLILDPFNGSGTTGVVASNLNRRYIGIDNVLEYLQITKNRHLKS